MESFVEQFNSLIRHRRSVKPEKYTAEPVSDSIIHQMLENAQWAPTHAMTEPWQFVVFRGAGLEKFAAFQAELYQTVTAEADFKSAKYDKLLSTPLKASHIIMIGLKRQTSEKLPLSEEICAVAAAVQNMQLTAAAYGIGCYWSTGGMTYHPEMKAFLGWGEKDACLGMLYIGNYTEPQPAPARTPVGEKTLWVTD